MVELVNGLRAAVKNDSLIQMPSWIGSLQEKVAEPASNIADAASTPEEER